MRKVAMLISRIPNPRTLKRIKALEKDYLISLLYWDRDLKYKEEFETSNIIDLKQILVKAPQGQPVKRIIPLIKFFNASLKGLKEVKPAIIHAENLDMLFIARYYQVFYNRNVKIVYEVADLPKYSFVKRVDSFKGLISKILQKIEKNLTRKTSILILTSPYFWDSYFEEFVDESKYLFIPNAPSKKTFNEYEKKAHDNFTIGFIGSVRYVPQLKMLIDAVGELNKDLQVFIAGGGPGYAEMAEYSRDKSFVEIYGPYNYEKEIVKLYEKVDCTYSVYNIELENVRIALPNRLYESIVCEIPIIGAKKTALGDFIEKNKIGITIDYNDKEGLKKELIRLINSKEDIKLYQMNCKRIKDHYYYENNSEKLLNEYRML